MSGLLVRLPRKVFRAIVVEPSGQGRFVWRVYRNSGAYVEWSGDPGTFDGAVRNARDMSAKRGIPAFYRRDGESGIRPLAIFGS
ncbi:MAG: hypothetical protein ABIS14_12190, partial [Sphingomonas sp.]